MQTSLLRVGAICAILTTASFATGIVVMASAGVETVIPETGSGTADWVEQVDEAGNAFQVGGWFVLLGGLLAAVALVAVYEAYRDSGQVMILAPVLTVPAMTLVTVSHLLPLEMASYLVPDYLSSSGAAHASLGTTLQLFTGTSLGLNLAGDTVLWGVVVPMYAVATLRTGVVARWIGWVGLVTAVFAGWLGPVGAVVPAVEAVTTVGFFAFFVWITAMGVALLRRPRGADAVAAATA